MKPQSPARETDTTARLALDDLGPGNRMPRSRCSPARPLCTLPRSWMTTHADARRPASDFRITARTAHDESSQRSPCSQCHMPAISATGKLCVARRRFANPHLHGCAGSRPRQVRRPARKATPTSSAKIRQCAVRQRRRHPLAGHLAQAARHRRVVRRSTTPIAAWRLFTDEVMRAPAQAKPRHRADRRRRLARRRASGPGSAGNGAISHNGLG